MSGGRQRHHELFDRKSWSANPDLASLRGDKRLIVHLDPDTHRELHESISHVPPLSWHIARAALAEFRHFSGTEDHIKALEGFQTSIERALKHPKADYLEREVGALTLHALDLQKPFIRSSNRIYTTGRR